MEQLPNYYAILTPEVRYSKELKPIEKLIFAEITALSNLKGYCFATNEYLASLYDVDPCTISRYISKLEKLHFVHCEYIKEGQIVKERHIFITPIDNSINGTVDNSVNGTVDQTVKENNKNINNINSNTINSSFGKAERKDNKSKVTFKKTDYTKVYEAYYKNCEVLFSQNKISSGKPELPRYISRIIKKCFEAYGVDKVVQAVQESINHSWLIEQGYPLHFILGQNELPMLLNKTYKNNRSGTNKNFNADVLEQRDFFAGFEEFRDGAN